MDDVQREPEHEDRASAAADEPAAPSGEAAAEPPETSEPSRSATAEFRLPDSEPTGTGAPDEPEPAGEEPAEAAAPPASDEQRPGAKAASLTRPDITVRKKPEPTRLDLPLPAREPSPAEGPETTGEAASPEPPAPATPEAEPARPELGSWDVTLPAPPPQQAPASEAERPAEEAAPLPQPPASEQPEQARVVPDAEPAPGQAPPQDAPQPARPQDSAGAWTAAAPETPPQAPPARPHPPQSTAPPLPPHAEHPPADGRQQATPWDAPPAQAAQAPGPAQVERPQAAGHWEVALPEPSGAVVPVRDAGPRAGYPGTRSSGQWTVPWEGQGTAPPVQPGAEGRPRRRRRGLIAALVALVLVVGAVAGQLVRPVPDPVVKLTLRTSSHQFPGAAPSLPWPAQGQSVVTVDGLGAMGSSGGSAPTPTASVAKVMTAYVYLRGHPLRPGEAGPVLTVSPQAAAQIPARRKRGESLLGVTADQRLTQRKALEALMIISANDVAHELARWDAGNEQAFVAKMNEAARSLGMTATTYTDPSGYDSRTVSTAADQVRLLTAAMRIPAFTEIVDNRAYVPDGGGQARPGGNVLIGQNGVVGGKTGYTDAAGGNFVFAARKRVAGVPTLIVGAVMAQRSTSAMAAVTAGQQLVAAAESALTAVTLAPAGARVARVDDGLGGGAALRAASAVTVVGWPGLTVPVGVQGDPPHRAHRGDRAGTVTAGPARTPLQLDTALSPPSLLNRLTRLS